MAKKKTRSSKRTKTSAAKAKSKSKSVSKKRPSKVATKARAKATPKKKKRAAKVAAKTKKTPPRAKKKRANKVTSKKATRAKKRRAAKATSKTATRAKTSHRKKVVIARPPRRDATGHLDPTYANELRTLSLESRNPDDNDDRTYFRKPRSHDDLAEELGEEAVATMTSGEDQTDRLQDAEVEEEQGGPFVTTKDSEEFAQGTDKSNPRDATREPFPRT